VLQALFAEPTLEVKPLDPGYTDHASDVWLVRTAAEEVVVRASRMNAEPDNDFWVGCRQLFGIDPRRVADMEVINGLLSLLSTIPVPRVLRKAEVEGRLHLVVEKLEGRTLPSFRELIPAALEDLGESLALIHAQRFDWCGSPAGHLTYPVDEFHHRLVATMREIAGRFYQEQPEVLALLAPMCAAAEALPTPGAGALIMVDLDPTQFLWDGRQITALVDTEAYGVGARELDFIALEYVLEAPQAAALAAGYRRVLPLPDLTAVRPVYRYLYRLMRVQGEVEMNEWMNWPVLFG
jgi:aminoglycoside phosphotransferase (APT) family kinase protein